MLATNPTIKVHLKKFEYYENVISFCNLIQKGKQFTAQENPKFSIFILLKYYRRPIIKKEYNTEMLTF